jgi:hypothetical protein
MPDYGRDLEFGYLLVSDHGDPPRALDFARRRSGDEIAPAVRERVAATRAEPAMMRL